MKCQLRYWRDEEQRRATCCNCVYMFVFGCSLVELAAKSIQQELQNRKSQEDAWNNSAIDLVRASDVSPFFYLISSRLTKWSVLTHAAHMGDHYLLLGVFFIHFWLLLFCGFRHTVTMSSLSCLLTSWERSVTQQYTQWCQLWLCSTPFMASQTTLETFYRSDWNHKTLALMCLVVKWDGFQSYWSGLVHKLKYSAARGALVAACIQLGSSLFSPTECCYILLLL